jgi:hypothetical protein
MGPRRPLLSPSVPPERRDVEGALVFGRPLELQAAPTLVALPQPALEGAPIDRDLLRRAELVAVETHEHVADIRELDLGQRPLGAR